MAEVGRLTTEWVVDALQASTGLASGVAALALKQSVQIPPLSSGQIIAQNAAFDLAERTESTKYPSVYVYCEKLTNSLKEKFRTFSGKAQMAIETRVTSDRLEDLTDQVQIYTSAVSQILDAQRGSWGNGMYYTGGYEITFGSARRGGRNYLQTVKTTFDVEVSIS